MSKRDRIGLLAFFGFLVLLNYPVVRVFDVPQLIGGIPQAFLLVFSLWLAIVGIAYVVSLDRHES